MVNPHGWTLTGEEGAAPDPIRLTFEKGNERGIVEIRSETRETVRITIDVTLK
jgi:hypothetical protein